MPPDTPGTLSARAMQNPRTELTMSSVKPFTDDSLSVSNVNSMAYSQGNPRVVHRSMEDIQTA
ncbi:hypothetical protein K100096D8_25630 [Eggerthella lenta]